jgi:hypothetical protein
VKFSLKYNGEDEPITEIGTPDKKIKKKLIKKNFDF